MNNRFVPAVVAALACCLAFSQPAAGPQVVNYQGRLARPSGQPYPNGPAQVRVRLFTAPSGGTLLWDSGLRTVQVTGGAFGLALTGGSPALSKSLFAQGLTFFEVSVVNAQSQEVALQPRQTVAGVPWAFWAEGVVDNAISTAKIQDGAVTSAKILDGAVTSSKILDGAVGTGDLAVGSVTAVQLASDPQSLNKVSAGFLFQGAGALGVGAPSPYAPFSAYRAGVSSVIARTDTRYVGMEVQESQGYLYTSPGVPLYLGPDGLTTLGIFPNGRIGIGTSSPQTKLDVEGGLRVNGDIFLETAGQNVISSSRRLLLQSGGGQDLYLNPAGGQTIANYLLMTGAAGSTGLNLSAFDNYADLRVIRNTQGGPDKDIYLGFGGPAGSKVRLYSSGSQTMVVSGGAVGVGGDPNGQTLSVHGNANKRDGGTSWAAWSDARMKTGIREIENPLTKLLMLHGRSYEWRGVMDMARHNPGPQMGFIAQEAEKIFPDWISTGANGYKLLNPKGFEALAVEAIREQQRQIEAVRAENLRLKRQNESLERRLAAIEARLRP